MIEDRELERPPLSDPFTQAGVTVRVHIYRFLDTDDPWTLEVMDPQGGSTVWDDTFPTAHAAYEAFQIALAEDGIGSFMVGSETWH